jgi:hypothetical protein
MLWNTLGLASDGSHEDDATANLEVLVSFTSDEELSTGVDIEHAIKLLLGNVLEVSKGHDTRVGGDDVDLSKMLLGLLEELHGLGHVGNVGLDGNRLATHFANLFAHFLGSGRTVGVVYDNVSTTAGELKSHLLADATAYTRQTLLFSNRFGYIPEPVTRATLPSKLQLAMVFGAAVDLVLGAIVYCLMNEDYKRLYLKNWYLNVAKVQKLWMQFLEGWMHNSYSFCSPEQSLGSWNGRSAETVLKIMSKHKSKGANVQTMESKKFQCSTMTSLRSAPP